MPATIRRRTALRPQAHATDDTPARKSTNLTLATGLVAEARELGVNLSQAAEAGNEPSGHRGRDGDGQNVEGDDPGDLIRRRRHGPLDLGQHRRDHQNGREIERHREHVRDQDRASAKRGKLSAIVGARHSGVWESTEVSPVCLHPKAALA